MNIVTADNPIFSIIIVTFNAKLTIDRAIKSVLSQNACFELILIDGASIDDTMERLRHYGNKINILVSEPDKGIYDAMNKAINRAKGDWLYFLGADDTLSSNILDLVTPMLSPAYAIVFGDVSFDSKSRMQSSLGPRTILQNTLHHQSAFYHRSNFTNFRYDYSLSIAADYELNLIIYLARKPVLHIPHIIADCATGGASSRLTDSLKETNIVRERYVKEPLKNAICSVILTFYYAQKRLRFWLYGHRV
ncbi:glycosyltransferase family 2 protein [Spirosoma areae]